MNEGRFITATFCDDIRYEVGNKYSLVGCYTSEMIIENLPLVLPKLCVSVSVHGLISKPYKQITIRASMNDITIAEQCIADENILSEEDLLKLKKKEFFSKFFMTIHLVFSPLLVEKDSLISITAETEDGIIQGPYFTMRQRNESDFQLSAQFTKEPV